MENKMNTYKKNIILESALEKISQASEPKVKTVAIAYSGGVDSSLGVALLKKVYKAEKIHLITIDIGQGHDELKQTIETAKALGITPTVIDAKEQFSHHWLQLAILSNASYCGYPVSTSMTRQLVAELVAKEALKLNCDAILEGSTGKGNDQYRMHNVFKIFAPELNVLVPVRDFDLSREEEIALCHHWEVPINEQISGGDDKTMWARSIASGAIGLNQQIPDDIWMWKKGLKQSPETPEQVEISFSKGLPVSLNGEELPLDVIIEKLNVIGGNHGIGAIDICEDGIMNLKSREIYEAPAAEIILKLHKDLEQFCLTKDELQFKMTVDAKWSSLVYHGMWNHPLKKALDAFIKETQHVVSGVYLISLYKGNIEIIKRNIPYSLFAPEFRSIGENTFNQKLCKGSAKVKGLEFEILKKRQSMMEKETTHKKEFIK